MRKIVEKYELNICNLSFKVGYINNALSQLDIVFFAYLIIYT